MSVQASSQWWRWPLVPIASIGGACLASFLFTLLPFFSFKSGAYQETQWHQIYIMPALPYGVFGYVLAYIAHSVAPKGKLVTSAIMATTFIVVMAFAVMLVYLDPTNERQVKIQVTLELVALVVGSLMGIVQGGDD